MSLTLGLLAAGATLAIHIEEAGEVPRELADRIEAALTAAIRARGITDVALDPARGACVDRACTAGVLVRAHAGEALLVRLIGGPIRVRVFLDHRGADARSLATAQGDLLKSGADLSEAIGRLVATTVPARIAREELRSGPPWLALGLFGVGAAGVASGIAMGLSSHGAVEALRAGASPASEVLRLSDRAEVEGTLATVLLGVAAGAVTGGVIAWLAD